MYGKEEGTKGVDKDFAEKSFENLGAWIMGEICSDLSAERGAITTGKVGGVLSYVHPFPC
jgi:hypothetical protein